MAHAAEQEVPAGARGGAIAARLAPAPLHGGPLTLLRFMRAEHAKWGKVVRDTGATIN